MLKDNIQSWRLMHIGGGEEIKKGLRCDNFGAQIFKTGVVAVQISRGCRQAEQLALS